MHHLLKKFFYSSQEKNTASGDHDIFHQGNQTELTLHIVPSPYGLDWSTPQSIARSVLKNYCSSQKRLIGHVMVELTSLKEKRTLLTGMTYKHFNPAHLLFKKHLGMGILFHSFSGRLENRDTLKNEITQQYLKGKIISLRYQINEKTAARLFSYYDSYRQQTHLRYGLYNRPRYGEGSGCTAFAMSFLELAGIITPEIKKHCSYHLNVPEELIGDLKDKKVSFFKIYFGQIINSWHPLSSTSGRKIFFWDPDAMYRYAEEVAQQEHSLVKNILKNKQLYFNAHEVAVPREKIFYHLAA